MTVAEYRKTLLGSINTLYRKRNRPKGLRFTRRVQIRKYIALARQLALAPDDMCLEQWALGESI